MNKTRMKIAIWVGTVVSVSACSSVLAHAESAGLNGLDPDRTGRIANVPVAHDGTTIRPAVLRQSREAPVTPAATVALAPHPPGVIDDKLLAGEIATRFEPLALCRIDVARNKQLRAEDVEADRLTLRWTIEPTGKVTATEVVGTTAGRRGRPPLREAADDGVDVLASVGRTAARRARVPVSISPPPAPLQTGR